MYPRNAASPEPIAIGAVVQISDGAVQTSGVTVRIKPVGVAEGNGAGATAYSTDGVVLYTPTQAETNYTSFVLIASKSGCIPASQTVVTSESTTAGRVYVATNGDKAGYTLSTAGVGAIADGVCDELLSGHTTPGTVGYILGGVLIAANFNQRTVQVTGSNHVAADIHELQPAVIQSTHFATDALDANALAASFVAEIQSGLSTLTAAQVNAEVLDVLQTDLFGELAAVPGASSSLKDKIAFLFMLARNRVTQTSTTQTLFADNTTTAVAAATTSDVGGTFTRGEFA